MGLIETSALVPAPTDHVFNKWTEWEGFPEFMPGVLEVKDLGGGRTYWKIEVGGRQVEWEAEILAFKPNSAITWRATSGLKTGGTVSFMDTKPDFHGCRVAVLLEYNPPGTLLGDLVDEFSFRHKVHRAIELALVAFQDHVAKEFSQTEEGIAFAASAPKRRVRRR